jgi:hypothetical protein
MFYLDSKERGQLQPSLHEVYGGKVFRSRFLVCLNKTSLFHRRNISKYAGSTISLR